MSSSPTVESVLETLTQQRLAYFGRSVDVGVPPSGKKKDQVAALARSGVIDLHTVLRSFSRDELRAACRKHGLEDRDRYRKDLMARLLGGAAPPAPRAPVSFAHLELDPFTPRAGDVVQLRHRQYLVDEVCPREGEHTLVRLVCLDDDAQGREVEVLWELELGARIISPEDEGLGALGRLDQPRVFGAYLHALKWSCVSATDARLFQAPFRAGIRLFQHQLTPLKKALELPRVNLFIADDVGLGKTIEAGLVQQELLLRQRVDWVLIVCPASVLLQWRDEMQKRFGLRFEIYNRQLVARRRQERGFSVNPWATHNRFIVSYQTLRRPEHRDPLLQHLGDRAKKSLLILDEAHTAAPSSASKYAIDSRVTKVIRDVAPRFENRLFLSATPHNGHSNSFSSLLEILDPQRFTRGVPIQSAAELEPVMVRRLKEDLRALGSKDYAQRIVGQLHLMRQGGGFRHELRWVTAGREGSEGPWELPGATGSELDLTKKLAEYTALTAPAKGRGRLVFINLQKRLLSSVEAFARTLKKHAESVGRTASAAADLTELADDESEYGADDDSLDAQDEARAGLLSLGLPRPEAKAKALLDDMLSLADRYRGAPDAKVLALLAWIRRHQCAAAGLPAGKEKPARTWGPRKLIVFTEYGDTKRYLLEVLGRALEATERGDERLLQLHGGMGDETREEVQRAFNAAPDQHPGRVLIATDAAREGINLQGACADLIHFDIPWNPARMEQRNGRIDRTLQPEPEVRCLYFTYADREEDLVLDTLVRKVDRIQRELGSVGAVVLERYAEHLEAGGIRPESMKLFESDEATSAQSEVARQELETQRAQESLARDLEAVARLYNRSKKVMAFEPPLLRDALDVGLQLAGAEALAPSADGSFTLPALPPSWDRTLDTLRPPKSRDEPFWEWRRRPAVPVVFEPPAQMTSEVAHLHLQHPFVQRLLTRFLAQGFSAHDLARVTVLVTDRDAIARVLAFGRLTLFGRGAVRLHDELVQVAAQWLESKAAGHLKPFADDADKKALEQLEQTLSGSPSLDGVSEAVQKKLLAAAPADFKALWRAVRHEADDRAHEAKRRLEQQGHDEAAALVRILENQREGIKRRLKGEQLSLFGSAGPKTQSEQAQHRQAELDHKAMEDRLHAIDDEVKRDPEQLRSSYDVVYQRLVPVGLVYLWPATR